MVGFGMNDEMAMLVLIAGVVLASAAQVWPIHEDLALRHVRPEMSSAQEKKKKLPKI